MATRRIPQRAELLLRSQIAPRGCSAGRSRITPSALITTRVLSTEAPRIQSKYINPALYDASILPPKVVVTEAPKGLKQPSTVPAHIREPNVLVTLYQYPTFAPLELLQYPATHLHLPDRPDILHDAVIYEHNAAQRKLDYVFHRSEMPGSSKKVRRQKGGGRARIGDSKAPHLHNGAATAHPPKPRDVSTSLPRKVYDLAWRTALTARYKRGELLIVDHVIADADSSTLKLARYVELFNGHSDGVVSEKAFKTKTRRKGQNTLWVLDSEERAGRLRTALVEWYETERVESATTIDVKNLLEGKRIVIEQSALNRVLRERQSDLQMPIEVEARKAEFAKDAESMAAAVEATRQLQSKSATAQLRYARQIADQEKAARAKEVKVARKVATQAVADESTNATGAVLNSEYLADSEPIGEILKSEEIANATTDTQTSRLAGDSGLSHEAAKAEDAIAKVQKAVDGAIKGS